MTTQTPDAVREAYMQGQVDMRERAAQLCDQRGAEEQEGFGLVRGTQNYFRARNAIRALEIAALDSRAGDAGEDGGKALFEHEMRQRGVQGLWADLDEDERKGWRESARAVLSATPAPAVDAQEGDDDGPCTDCGDTGITIQTERACSCEAGDQHRPPVVDAVPAGEVVERLKETADDLRKIGWHEDRQNVLDAIAALSHGEGRK